MKILDGLELSGYIKERQLKQSRALRQSWRVIPCLAIVYTGDNPVINTYMRLKCEYGQDILVDVKVFNPSETELINQITELNNDENIHGIIVQLPLANSSQTDKAINAINSQKDVDGLGCDAVFTPATAMAIDWLLAGYNVNLVGEKIVIVGNGRLVGSPLAKIWKKAGLDVTVCDNSTLDLGGEVSSAKIVVTATGVPGLITSEMISSDSVVVDAGTASEQGKIVGDLAPGARLRKDLTITPEKGGVGPLTVAALFDNVLLAARRVADKKGQQDLN